MTSSWFSLLHIYRRCTDTRISNFRGTFASIFMLTEFGPEVSSMFLRNVVINYTTRRRTNIEPFRFPTRCLWKGGGENLKRLVMTIGCRNYIIIFRVGPYLVVNVVVDNIVWTVYNTTILKWCKQVMFITWGLLFISLKNCCVIDGPYYIVYCYTTGWPLKKKNYRRSYRGKIVFDHAEYIFTSNEAIYLVKFYQV
jgi:hypothetical protein